MLSPVRFDDGALKLLDQTRLPAEERWLECRTAEDVADAIRRLAVRGAPAIGLAAAYGLALGVRAGDGGAPLERFERAAALLGSTRPTAVNLQWAIARARKVAESRADEGTEVTADALLELAERLVGEQREADRRIGELGAAWEEGRLSQVWVGETRPLLQGSRLTAWELGRAGIPFRLVTDASAGTLMARGLVDRVVVGADRIAANGDVANKIGTYPIAVLAARHGVPFYVAAPRSTIDPDTPTGAEIAIEERDPREVTRVGGSAVAPAGAAAVNFAFDVTPAELVTAIVTEAGVLRPPYETSIAEAFRA